MPLFFFYKIKEEEGRTGPAWGFGIIGRGEDMGKRCGRMNIVKILCIHWWKNDTC
jgi:hypothetical protein